MKKLNVIMMAFFLVALSAPFNAYSGPCGSNDPGDPIDEGDFRILSGGSGEIGSVSGGSVNVGSFIPGASGVAINVQPCANVNDNGNPGFNTF